MFIVSSLAITALPLFLILALSVEVSFCDCSALATTLLILAFVLAGLSLPFLINCAKPDPPVKRSAATEPAITPFSPPPTIPGPFPVSKPAAPPIPAPSKPADLIN